MAFGLEPLVRGWDLRKALLAATFLGSMLVTASLLGASLGTTGELLGGRTAGAVAILSASALALMVELRLAPFDAPYRHWQVPRDWPARFGAFRGYSLWGAVLGAGVFSYVPFASFHVMVLWMFLSGGPTAGAAIGVSYGAGRALASLVPAALAARRSGQLVAVAAGPLGRYELVRATQIVALAGAILVILVIWP